MANTYEFTRPQQWEAPGRSGVEQHLGEVEAALGGLSAGVDTVSANLNDKISSLSTDLGGRITSVSNTLDGKITSVSSTLDGKISTLSSSLTGKINSVAAAKEVVTGHYAGDNTSSRDINLGFQPRAVLLEIRTGKRADNGDVYGGLALPDVSLAAAKNGLTITASGFRVYFDAGYVYTNQTGNTYLYLAVL